MKHFSDLHHADLVREHHHQLHHTAIAGAAAGFLQSFIVAPVDTLTMRTETDPHMRDWIHQAQQHTVASLWRGFHLTLFVCNLCQWDFSVGCCSYVILFV
jgi:hypothetical protein